LNQEREIEFGEHAAAFARFWRGSQSKFANKPVGRG
jgi:hypothetical protein